VREERARSADDRIITIDVSESRPGAPPVAVALLWTFRPIVLRFKSGEFFWIRYV
jgi:hypothetical protein